MCKIKMYIYKRTSSNGKIYEQRCKKTERCHLCGGKNKQLKAGIVIIPPGIKDKILDLYKEKSSFARVSRIISKEFPDNKISAYKVKQFIKLNAEKEMLEKII